MFYSSTLSFFLLFPIFFNFESLATERKEAKIVCLPTQTKLQFDCDISLKVKKTDKPVESAIFSVGADMPSMPGAHNVKPVNAKPKDKAGRYSVLIQLEMFGEWILKLNISKPTRDIIVKKLYFSNKGGKPLKHLH